MTNERCERATYFNPRKPECSEQTTGWLLWESEKKSQDQVVKAELESWSFSSAFYLVDELKKVLNIFFFFLKKLIVLCLERVFINNFCQYQQLSIINFIIIFEFFDISVI